MSIWNWSYRWNSNSGSVWSHWEITVGNQWWFTCCAFLSALYLTSSCCKSSVSCRDHTRSIAWYAGFTAVQSRSTRTVSFTACYFIFAQFCLICLCFSFLLISKFLYLYCILFIDLIWWCLFCFGSQGHSSTFVYRWCTERSESCITCEIDSSCKLYSTLFWQIIDTCKCSCDSWSTSLCACQSSSKWSDAFTSH